MRTDSPARLRAAPSWALLLGGGRGAFRLLPLVPVWIVWSGLAYGSHLSRSGSVWLYWGIGSALLFLAAGWASLCETERIRGGTGGAPGARELLRRFRRHLPPLVLAPAGTLMTAGFFLAPAIAGGLVGLVPWCGPWLATAWTLTGGLVLSMLAAAWLVVGIPAVTIQIPAAVTEHPHTFEIASRTLSYVRNRPLRVLRGWLTVLGGALLGSAAFAGFLFLVLSFLCGVWLVAEGLHPDPSLAAATVWSVALDGGTWLPLGIPGLEVSGAPSSASPFWLAPLWRLLPAFFLTAVFVGGTRLYLLLRWDVDGTALDEAE